MIDFKTLLKEEKAKWIAQAGQPLRSVTELKRWWPDVHSDSVFACLNYLNSKTSVLNDRETAKLFVIDPKVDGQVMQGAWRLVYAGIEDGRAGVVQVLRKGFVQTVKSGDVYDFSEFLVEGGDLWHSGASMPVLRLPNVDPSMEEAIRLELQAATTFDGPKLKHETLTGSYYFINAKPRPEEDGSYSLLLFLSKHNNSDLYFKVQDSPTTIRGYFYKWEATEATLAELLETKQFDAAGDIVESGGKTLQEEVPGRLVKVNRLVRDLEDRLFDVEVEIVWPAENSLSTAGTPGGAYDIEAWVDVFRSATALPTAADLKPLIDAPGFGDTTHRPGYEDYGTGAELLDPVYYGMWTVRKELTGPTGSGIPVLNSDKTYDYAIVSTKTKVSTPAWIMAGGISHETARKETTVSRSFQQIEVRVGGDLEYEKGGNNGNELVGIDWNTEWDSGNANGNTYPNAVAPNNWISAGYYARYGEWRPYWKKGYLMGPGSLRTNGSGGLICRGPKNNYDVYQIGDVVWDAAASAFKVLAGATLWAFNAGDYAMGAVRQSGNKVYTCKSAGGNNDSSAPGSDGGAPFWDEGAQSNAAMTWSAYDADLVVAKIAKAGVGEAPFEQADLYVPILQELREPVEWDSDWEWADGTYPANSVVFYLVNGLRYKSNKSTANIPTVTADWSVTTENPSGWDTGGYVGRHGNWLAQWSKGFATGAGSIRTNSAGPTICRGLYLSSTIVQIGDVFLYSGNLAAPVFKIVSGATLWAYNAGTYAAGSVRQSGNKVYTCKTANSNNAMSAPGSEAGATYWDEGARADAVTWADFDKDYVVSKICQAGVGASPFESEAQVPVLDSSGTNYALSARARVLRYVSPENNPRMCEIIAMTNQEIESVSFDTHFAFNPSWLDQAFWRIETGYASLEDIYDDAYALTEGKLTIPYNPERSNFSIKHDLVPGRDGTFAIRKTIELRGEWVPDAAALYARGQEVAAPATYGISGRHIMIYTDMTGIAAKPWSGSAKAV